MNEFFTNLKHSRNAIFGKAVQTGLVVLGLLIAPVLSDAQTPDCNIIMACNDNVQVSLGDDCTELVVPDIILEDPVYPDNYYTVTLYRENGSIVADNILRQNMIGELLSAKVKLNGCAISCWGNLTVEDKLPPRFLSCPSPLEVECGDSTNPGAPGVPRPIAVDACTAVTLKNTDEVKKLQCNEPYTMTITRRWIATDNYGNSASCTQIINIRRASIDDVVMPQDYVGPNALECGAPIQYLDNGAPHPNATGYPVGVDCPNIQYFFNDVVFNLCGNGKKVLRQWTVLDWCTGRDTVGSQIIKVLDTRPPVCTSTNGIKYTINTDPGKCFASFDAPAPPVTFECSNYDYIVGYKIKDNTGPLVNVKYDNVLKIYNQDGSYYYKVQGLPKDTAWVVYTITDACGHVTQCYFQVLVKDKESPSAICEGYTVVTLGDDGWGDVKAESIDDHSKDNCEIVKYELKRQTNDCAFPSDLNFGPYVNFCCNDVSEDPNYYVKVVLRVTDASGNYNDCVANVKVQDKKDPTIQCPANITIQCSQEAVPSLTGMATGTDNCEVDITFTDVDSRNACGIGTISRRWTAKDPGGRSRSCTQNISVIDSNPFSHSNVNWPADITINGCSAVDADPLLTGSFPTYTNDDCADIAVSYEDQEFTIQNACIMITRKWRLVDWCRYTPQNPNYIENVQKITLRNTEAPEFVTSCADRTIDADGIDCEAYVEHYAEATDDCTASSQIKYRWELDLYNNNSVDNSGNGSFVANVYPTGRHRFTFFATDYCGNTSTCSYIFTVRDNKAPTPICHRELVWVLDEDGRAEVWASDFDLKSFDFCDQYNLTFSFNASGTQRSRFFDCDDIENGIAQEIALQMHVIDTYGNSEYCDVKLILQDSPNKNACPDRPGAKGRIGGSIMHPSQVGMQNVDIRFSNMFTHEVSVNSTDATGHFEFDQAEFYGDYVVKPTSNKDILNGVSTLDLVHIQRHILGIETISNPINLIAADINADQKISTSDLVGLRKVILGITHEYQNNNSWKFMPLGYEFSDPTYPYEFQQEIRIDSLLLNQMDANFHAIKIGDVNNSSKPNLDSDPGSKSRNRAVQISIHNLDIQRGETVIVPLMAEEDAEVYGLQMALGYDSDNFEVVSVRPGVIPADEGSYFADNDQVRVSFAAADLMRISKGDVLVNLVVRAKQSTDLGSISLDETVIRSEAYTTNFEEVDLSLELRNALGSGVEAVKNAPNPFSESTAVSILLEEGGSDLDLKIFDVAGKVVYQSHKSGHEGLNTFHVTSNDLESTPGVYFFQIENGTKVFLGKMILVR